MFNFTVTPPHLLSPLQHGRDGSGCQPLAPACISGMVVGDESISICNTM